MRVGIYVDRADLVENTSKVLPTSIPWIGWLMVETSDGRMRVKNHDFARNLISHWNHKGGLHAVVWPRDGQEYHRYDHIITADMKLRADVEGQDRDGHLERSHIYTGGVTSFPFHKIIKDWQHPQGEEVQVYPTRTNSALESKVENAIDWSLSRTGANMVALPLYGLTGSDGARKHGSPRKFLNALVRRCVELDVDEINFWSAKHLWKNNYALPFITEDLPKLVSPRDPEPPRTNVTREEFETLKRRVRALECLHELA